MSYSARTPAEATPQHVCVEESALPAGAATEASLAALTKPSDQQHVLVDNGPGLGLTDTQLRATAVPVSGTFYPATQPVSATALPLPTGASTEATLLAIKAKTDNLQATMPVSLAAAPTTPVTGTFWQATQPVSGPVTDAQLRASAVPVSGTFYPATQPVSIASMPSTPVTGTFWQATQPVSGPFYQATQPVSGTFWQATQPVSIASMPSTPVTGPLTDAQLRASAVPVSGTFYQATQPVSVASMPSTPVTGTFWQGTQPVSVASMPSTPVTGTFWQSTQPVSIASMPSTPVTGAFYQATQPVSAAALPLPSGASTETTLAALLTALNATQAASYVSQGGPMIQGAVDDTPQGFVDGQIRPLSLTTEGRLRVSTTIAPTHDVSFFEHDAPDFLTSPAWMER